MAKRIVVADDEPDGLELTADQLIAAGYEVILAHDGQEAFDLITQHVPDMVLLDVRMPRLTGYEVCERVKNDAHLCKIPVMLMTANSINITPEKVRDVKGEGYILRPYKAAALIEKIRSYIGA